MSSERPKIFWRKKTPTVIQMQAVECGAASLKMILAYFGKWVPLEELRIRCNISRSGSNALHIVQAAKSYGLRASGHRREVSDLYSLKEPVILFWEYRHFVVLEGFSKTSVFLNDPAVGPREVSYQQLNDKFTGIVLEFSTLENFEKGGEPFSFRKEMQELLTGLKSAAIYLSTAAVCLILPGVTLPFVARIFIDHVLISDEFSLKTSLLLFLAIGAFFAMGLNFLRCHVLSRINIFLSLSKSAEFFRHILHLPISYYTQRFSGETAFKAQLNNRIAEAVSGSIIVSFIDLFRALIFVVLMYFFDPMIASIALGLGGLNLAALYFIQMKKQGDNTHSQIEFGKAVGFSIGGLQNIESIKVAGRESDFFARLSGHFTSLINSYLPLSKPHAFIANLPGLMQILAFTALFGIGVIQILHGNLSPGELVALQILIFNFFMPISNLLKLDETFQTLKNDLKQLEDVIENPKDFIYRVSDTAKREKLLGRMECKNIFFGYAPLDPPLIKGVSFTIEQGKKVALVGPTGSGKSTLAKLLSALYLPTKGEIFYDQIPLQTMSADLLYSHLATITRDVFLFEGTIKENLTFWDDSISEEAIVKAAQDAEIHEVILNRTGGYDAALTEEGMNFSEGERQRLEIARGLLSNPKILVMDEIGNALDFETEKKILDNIRKRGCSCLIITHRLSTAADCDEILVLDQGEIVQRGTHQSLRKSEGLYRTLLEEQEAANG